MNKIVLHLLVFCSLLLASSAFAQQKNALINSPDKVNPTPGPSVRRCATMEAYNKLFKDKPQYKAMFEANQKRISSLLHTNSINRTNGQRDTIAIVIHVIGSNSMQSAATNANLATQIDVLNEDYNAANADSTRIPTAFKQRFGNMGVIFRLAQTDPDGILTNGIERRTNNIAFNLDNYDDAKSFATGGLNAWDPTQYINLWVVDFGNSGLLGISVFPGDPRPIGMHGVLCDYRSFGRGAPYLYSLYNRGRTISHELGHFFNLRHIWGDDGGDCSGTDFPDSPPGLDDTPNQGDNTFGNPDVPGTGTVVTDNCSVTAPGIMYQNYMDYTDDVDLVMFTQGQASRMLTALNTSPDRSPLLNSTAFHTPVIYSYDARMKSIVSPVLHASFCNGQVIPTIKIRNQGTTTLTSVVINTSVNNSNLTATTFHLNLAYNTDTTLTLPAVTGLTGNNVLKIFTSIPDGQADENNRNDTLLTSFIIKALLPLNSIAQENFNTSAFPPPNWQVINPDNDFTWEWNSNFGAKQKGSAWINNYNNQTYGLHDDLVMPNYGYQNVDSVFIDFRLAAAVYSDPNTKTIPIDTLSVLLSKDCGNTYTTIYKKWGTQLQTTDNPNVGDTAAFFPKANNWRKDSINLGQWLGNSETQFEISFRYTGNFENNVFLDDVNLYTKVLPKSLKDIGYLILPTVFQNQFSIWHYKPPTDLKSISVYSSNGQLVWTRQYSGNADNYITIDLSNQSKGVYIVSLAYTDKKNISQQVIRN